MLDVRIQVNSLMHTQLSLLFSPKNAIQIHRGPRSSVSELTARFDPRCTVVIDVGVANDNVASTTGNNVGTTSSFKEILAPR